MPIFKVNAFLFNIPIKLSIGILLSSPERDSKWPWEKEVAFLKREGGCVCRQHHFYVVYTLHEETESRDWLFGSDAGPFNQALSCETVQEKSAHDC